METVDASALTADLSDLVALDHSYFAEEVRMLDDIVAVLLGTKPSERAALRPATNPAGAAYWIFKK